MAYTRIIIVDGGGPLRRMVAEVGIERWLQTMMSFCCRVGAVKQVFPFDAQGIQNDERLKMPRRPRLLECCIIAQ
jgi:hypothetical protein